MSEELVKLILSAKPHSTIIDCETGTVHSLNQILQRSFQMADVLERELESEAKVVGVQVGLGVDWIETLFSLWALGRVPMLLGERWPPDYVAKKCSQVDCGMVICSEKVSRQHTTAVRISERIALALLERACRGVYRSSGESLLVCSSGTTGSGKIVKLSADGLWNNATAVAQYLDLTPDDVSMIFTKSCYIYTVSQLLSNLSAGSRILVYSFPFIQAGRILIQACRYDATGLSATPTIFRTIFSAVSSANNVRKKAAELHLRYAMTGGQPIDEVFAQSMLCVFPSCSPFNMYGCTENSPRISYLPPKLFFEKVGAVGTAVYGTDIRMGRVVSSCVGTRSTIREIEITGNSLFIGYAVPQSEGIKRTADGWFRTGDLGYFDDDGILYLAGRTDTVINCGNEKILPEEVEGAICSFEGVAEARVVGRPDEHFGAVAIAEVVPQAGFNLDVQNLRGQLQRSLPGFMVPKEFYVMACIPRTEYGKIKRKGDTDQHEERGKRTI